MFRVLGVGVSPLYLKVEDNYNPNMHRSSNKPEYEHVGALRERRVGVIGTAMIGLWLDMSIQGSSLGPSGQVVPKPYTLEPQVATSLCTAPQLFQQLA